MKNYQVVRTDISPYQSEDFLQREKKMIEQYPGLKYSKLEDSSDKSNILITNTHTNLRKLPKKLLKHTQLIIHPNSGYDNFHNDRKIWNDIPLVIGHVIRSQAVAEYYLGAVFESLLDIPRHLTWNKERKWNRTLLKETNVWIFGYGHVGKIISDTLSTLGVKVTVVDPFVKNCPHKCLDKWQNGKIENARVIISALSLNSTTFKYFNRDFFNSISNMVLFINGARGELVDESSLKNYLILNPNSFAYLDVFGVEPFGQDWHGFPQVWKTSHIAGVEKNLDTKILDFENEVIKSFMTTNSELFLKRFEKQLIQKKWIEGVLI
jgi:D-3-phosphoglycerate dehydrogenase